MKANEKMGNGSGRGKQMKIFPAIDLMNGEAVRLTKGDFDTKEVFSSVPNDVLEKFKCSGADSLHLVDLDGARDGSIANFETIKTLAKRKDFFIEVGGGIRDMERIEKYLELGVGRVILGTVAATNFQFVEDAVKKYGKAIAVGVDAMNGYVAINGWKTITEMQDIAFCAKCRDAGVSTIIYTDISKDGAMEGTNLKVYEKLSNIENLKIVASGGISFLKEIEILRDMNIYGAILGKALYKGLIDLSDAIKTAGQR